VIPTNRYTIIICIIAGGDDDGNDIGSGGSSDRLSNINIIVLLKYREKNEVSSFT